MPLSRGALSGAAAASIVLTACGGGNAASQLANAPEYAPKGQTRCGVTKSQARPLIVEWPSADRQELESKVQSGLAVVRYQGCEMDVLDRCSVPARYSYRGTTRAHDKLVIRNEDDLYASLPVGAARLEGTLERTGQLNVSMDLVGRYESERATVRLDELQGECSGATHFVYGLSVGAFDFYAGSDARVGGGAGFVGIGAGASSQASEGDHTTYGDPAACAKSTSADKAPPEGCGALIRIEVVPLAGATQAAPAPPVSMESQREPFIQECMKKAQALDYCECGFDEFRQVFKGIDLSQARTESDPLYLELQERIVAACGSKLPEGHVRESFLSACVGNEPRKAEYCQCAYPALRKALSLSDFLGDFQGSRFDDAKRSMVRACRGTYPVPVAKAEFMGACTKNDPSTAGRCECVWSKVVGRYSAEEVAAGLADLHAALGVEACR